MCGECSVPSVSNLMIILQNGMTETLLKPVNLKGSFCTDYSALSALVQP